MVVSCCAINCKERRVKKTAEAEDGLAFFSFPLKDKTLTKKWIHAIRRKNFKPTVYSRVCEKHFPKDSFKSTGSRKILLPDAVPSIVLGITIAEGKPRPPPKDRSTPLTASSSSSKSSQPSLSLPELSSLIQSEHNYCCLDSVVVRKRRFEATLESCSSLRKKLKSSMRVVNRQQKQISTLQDALDDLKSKSLVSENTEILLKGHFSGIMDELLRNSLQNDNVKNHGKRYSDEIKKFSLTVHFYSPAAFRYLRSLMPLPDPRSIRNWTSTVRCEAGFFKDVFAELQKRAEECPEIRDCVILFDSMHIKSRTIYNKTLGRYEGFVDYGDQLCLESAEGTLATEALTFMVVGLGGRMKTPIGYFLVNKISAELQCRMLQIAIKLLRNHKTRAHAVTCDGASVNPKTMSLLGVDWLGENINSALDTNFTYGSQMYFILDPCHALKLARNALADLRVMYDAEGNVILWEHIELLHRIQDEVGLKFGNKLRFQHIAFHRNKMKVQIAAQTLSSSVADAINFLKSYDDRFQNSDGTVIFLKNIDKLFDLMNSRSPYAKGYKRPVSLAYLEQWESQMKNIQGYLEGLTDSSGRKIKDGPRKTFVRGFICSIQSIVAVTKNLLTRPEKPLKYVLTYRYSQDPLEMFFRCIRGKNGYNSNPDVVQFRSSIKRILLRNSIRSSPNANCLDLEGAECSSVFNLKWKKRSSSLHEPEVTEEINEEFENEFLQYCAYLDESSLGEYQEAILGYISGYIVLKMFTSISCSECLDALTLMSSWEHSYSCQDEPYLRLIRQKQQGGLISPSKDVVKIVIKCEKAFRLIVCGKDGRSISANKNLHLLLFRTVMMDIREKGRDSYFSCLYQHDMETASDIEDLHSSQLIKKICQLYLETRLKTYGQKFYTDIIQQNVTGKRQQMTKLLTFWNC